MFNWLRNLFTKKKAAAPELPPKRQLVQWFPAANMWVPYSVQYWCDRGYSLTLARQMYQEGVTMALELTATGQPRDGNKMYGGASKPSPNTPAGPIGPAGQPTGPHGRTGPTKPKGDSDESTTNSLLLAEELALATAGDFTRDETPTGDVFHGAGGSFGGAGASSGWDAPSVPSGDSASSGQSGGSVDTGTQSSGASDYSSPSIDTGSAGVSDATGSDSSFDSSSYS
jgi:hypothetical protein